MYIEHIEYYITQKHSISQTADMRDMRARQYRVHIANIVVVSDFHIEITYWQYWCTATGAYRYQRGEFLEVICLKKIDIRRYVCSDTNPTIETKSARDMVDTHLIADTSKDSYRFISVHVVTHRLGCPYRSNGVHIVSISCQIMKISRREAIWKAQDISTKISTYWAPYRYLGEYGSRIWGTLGSSPVETQAVDATQTLQSGLDLRRWKRGWTAAAVRESSEICRRGLPSFPKMAAVC